jgi:hypothetical protein
MTSLFLCWRSTAEKVVYIFLQDLTTIKYCLYRRPADFSYKNRWDIENFALEVWWYKSSNNARSATSRISFAGTPLPNKTTTGMRSNLVRWLSFANWSALILSHCIGCPKNVLPLHFLQKLQSVDQKVIYSYSQPNIVKSRPAAWSRYACNNVSTTEFNRKCKANKHCFLGHFLRVMCRARSQLCTSFLHGCLLPLALIHRQHI